MLDFPVVGIGASARGLTANQQSNAVAIVLSGTGSDRTLGIRAIKESGGLTLVQDETSAQFDGMPKSSISTGMVDLIRPTGELAKELANYIKHPLFASHGFAENQLSKNQHLYIAIESNEMKFLIWHTLLVGLTLFVTSSFLDAEEEMDTQAVTPSVCVYPAPEEEVVRGVYSITVNGKPVDVYSAQTLSFDGDYYFASFDFSGTVSIKISSPFPMEKTEIIPNRFVTPYQLLGTKEIQFEADKPFKIAIEPNGRIKPLLLFGNEIETDVPNANDPNVMYFGPGVHRPGAITLKSDQTLYLAGGAVVKGAIFASGENIVVRGRGVLAGEDYPKFKGPDDHHPIDCKKCKGLVIRDIILRNSYTWTSALWGCEGVTFDGLKICGSRLGNDDALDIINSRNVVVKNCFFRTKDDSIAVKGLNGLAIACENIMIEDCQLWTDGANVFRIGYESDTDGMRNIVAKNIDVLHYRPNVIDPAEFWATAIILLQPSQKIIMEECHFEDITIYCDGSDMNLLKAKPMSCSYGPKKNPEPGSIKNCSFKRIRVIGTSGDFKGRIYIEGESPSQNVDNLTFEKIEYFGNPILKDSPSVQIGMFSTNILFLN